MKKTMALIAAGGLLVVAQQAYACPGKQHGYGDNCPTGGGHMQMMDKNGDSVVSKKEFDTFHAERFKSLDANKDGKLSADELETMPAKPVHGMGGGNMRMSLEQHFDAADTNQDGALSREEAKEKMPILFDRFDENDANKDGMITKDEVMRDPQRKPRRMQDGSGMMPVTPIKP